MNNDPAGKKTDSKYMHGNEEQVMKKNKRGVKIQ